MDPDNNEYATPPEIWRPLSRAVGGFDLQEFGLKRVEDEHDDRLVAPIDAKYRAVSSTSRRPSLVTS